MQAAIIEIVGYLLVGLSSFGLGVWVTRVIDDIREQRCLEARRLAQRRIVGIDPAHLTNGRVRDHG